MRHGTSLLPVMAEAVLDASALVDLLLGGTLGNAVATRIAGHGLHGPAHLDAEAFSVIGRLQRAGEIDAEAVGEMIDELASAPIVRHAVASLLRGAWARRGSLRFADAVYVELAESLKMTLVTTDGRLASAAVAEVVTL
jgi:predicted nucleic acid-binding protein